jgi:hypothetical protein
VIDRRSCVLFFTIISASTFASAQSRRIAFNDVAPAQARTIKRYADPLVVQNTGSTTSSTMTTTVAGSAVVPAASLGVVRASTVTGIPATAASPLGAAYSPAPGPVPVANQVPLLPEKSGGGNGGGGGGSPGGGGGGSPQQKEEAAAAEKKQKAKMEEARDELDEREKKIKKREEEQDKKDKKKSQQPTAGDDTKEKPSALAMLKKLAEAAKANKAETGCRFTGVKLHLNQKDPPAHWVPLRIEIKSGNQRGKIYWLNGDTGETKELEFIARANNLYFRSEGKPYGALTESTIVTAKNIVQNKHCEKAKLENSKLKETETAEPSRFDKPASGGSKIEKAGART